MKKRLTRLAIMFFAFCFLIFQTTASAKNADDIDILSSSIYSHSDKSKAFDRLIFNNLKFISARSLTGSNQGWLASVDIFEQYNNGKSENKFLLQASAQYGLLKIPNDISYCSIILNPKEHVNLNANNDISFYYYDELKNSENVNNDISMIVRKNSINISIKMSQNYPSKTIPSYETALSSMMPAYINFITKNEHLETINHTVLKLKSYIKDFSKLSKNYSWELFLVASDKLPCQATIIRYDCSTKRVSVSQKEIRDYV